jgi:hypothetical protein
MIRWVNENPGLFFAGVITVCICMMGLVLVTDWAVSTFVFV